MTIMIIAVLVIASIANVVFAMIPVIWKWIHGWKLIPVDAKIADIIKMLNDKGYETLASCEGHGDEPNSKTYVSFSSFFIVDEMLPKGNKWRGTVERWDGGHVRYSLRLMEFGRPPIHFSEKYLARRREELLDWARSLPKTVKKKI